MYSSKVEEYCVTNNDFIYHHQYCVTDEMDDVILHKKRTTDDKLDWHMQITINILLNIPRRKFLINPYKANYFLSSSIWDNTVSAS